MVWKPENPEGNEAAKVRFDIARYTRGRVLDLGCGPWKCYPHFISVDNYSEWQGLKWRPDICGDATDLGIFATNSIDAVFSSHLLEHIDDYVKALHEWWRVIKIGGYLILYLPHKSLYPNIGQPGSNPDHRHDFEPKDIVSIMTANAGDWDLLESEIRSAGDEYSFFQVFQKLGRGTGHVYSYCAEKPKKKCAIVRYGGYGDMLQASAILPELKRQGYYITLYTTPYGEQIVRHDPHIDEFIIQDNGQVPNQWLVDFWAVESKKYDKFINLSESVEGVWLAMEGRQNHMWPKAVRDKYMNTNYEEFAFDLAGLRYTGDRQRFYATDRERRIASKRRSEIDGKVVLWTLAGSSVHKIWPHLDAVIAEFMIRTKDIHFMLVGDASCKLLEAGWQKEPRVHRRSGEWSIRETLAFAETVDLVIGPETGVLNSVSGLDIPKICFLSHSSVENLTKHWKNCVSMMPTDCECYPCHILHNETNKYCTRDQRTGTAMCQVKIEPPVVLQAMVELLGITKNIKAA